MIENVPYPDNACGLPVPRKRGFKWQWYEILRGNVIWAIGQWIPEP